MNGNDTVSLSLGNNLTECGQSPYVLTLAISPIPNLCVIWLILAGSGKKVMDIASLNQALCELTICAFHGLWLISSHTTQNYDFLLLLYRYTVLFSLGLLFMGRPAFMSWVCLERYLAVVHPVTFLKYKNLTFRVVVAIVVWLVVLACGLMIIWVPYPTVYYVCFGLISPSFVLQLFCSLEILRALVRPGPGDGNRDRQTMNSAKLSAFRAVTIILVAEVVGFTPVAVATVLLSLDQLEKSEEIFCTGVYFIVVSSTIPPLIFINRARKYCCKGSA